MPRPDKLQLDDKLSKKTYKDLHSIALVYTLKDLPLHNFHIFSIYDHQFL